MDTTTKQSISEEQAKSRMLAMRTFQGDCAETVAKDTAKIPAKTNACQKAFGKLGTSEIERLRTMWNNKNQRFSICTFVAALWMAMTFYKKKDRKSVMLGVWAAPGAPETLAKGEELRPPPFGMVSGAPGAAQTHKMTDFRPLTNYKV